MSDNCYCGMNYIVTERCTKCNIMICQKCQKSEMSEKRTNKKYEFDLIPFCVSCYYKRKEIRYLKKIYSKLEAPDN